MNQISLAIQMLFILKTQGIVKKEVIAQQLEVSEKMVQRLRQQLEVAGYEIQIERGIYGGYRLTNSSFFPVTNLSTEELKALSDAYLSLIDLEYPFINTLFKQAYAKIIGNHENQSIPLSIFQTKQLNVDYDQLDQRIGMLQHAINQRQIITLDYVNQKQYEIEPYEVFQVDNAWYVIGHQRYNDVRIFRLDRIILIKIHDRIFIRDKSFNVRSYLTNFGFKIEKPIILKGELADMSYLKEFILSDYQVIKGQQFEIKFYSLNKAKAFILSQGSNLIIHSPMNLKEYQKEEAMKVLKHS